MWFRVVWQGEVCDILLLTGQLIASCLKVFLECLEWRFLYWLWFVYCRMDAVNAEINLQFKLKPCRGVISRVEPLQSTFKKLIPLPPLKRSQYHLLLLLNFDTLIVVANRTYWLLSLIAVSYPYLTQRFLSS